MSVNILRKSHTSERKEERKNKYIKRIRKKLTKIDERESNVDDDEEAAIQKATKQISLIL